MNSDIYMSMIVTSEKGMLTIEGELDLFDAFLRGFTRQETFDQRGLSPDWTQSKTETKTQPNQAKEGVQNVGN